MGFNPLEQKGMPLDRQLRNWSDLNVKPYDKDDVDPYTQTRVITLNGAEMENVWFSHQFARHTADMDTRRYLAQVRRVEQQQQKAINWLTPGNSSPLETTIGYEQVAVDLTAWLARHEPDAYLKQIYQFGLLEDFDHLYRYADLMDLLDGKKAEKIVRDLTEIMPGRPTFAEHRHPYDDVRRPINGKALDDPTAPLRMMTIVAAEQQTMNFYLNVGNMPEHPLARALYQEIAMIEEQHVTHYESLLDPTASWWKREVLHQYNECYLYHSFMQQETDKGIRRLFELHLDMEIEHLRLACERYKKVEKRDPTEFLPKELPDVITFEENREYVRKVLSEQINLTADLEKFRPVDELPDDHRYFQYQRVVNGNGFVPSERVIAEHIEQFGDDYRSEIDGPHPIESLQKETYGRSGKARKDGSHVFR